MRACTSSGPPATRKSFCYIFWTSYNFLASLKPLDIEIMKRLGTRVNLIPVIAKADTLTQSDLVTFKQRVCHFFFITLESAIDK
jgi:hypothetical protein